jgi:mannitol-specific phosphotransferase system IIBC component
MGEFGFIVLVIILAFIVTLVVNNIISKKNRDAEKQPKFEKYSENLNNLNNIVAGVEKKNIVEEKKEEQKTHHDVHKNLTEHTTQRKTGTKDKDKKEFDLKNAMISKEILDRKK